MNNPLLMLVLLLRLLLLPLALHQEFLSGGVQLLLLLQFPYPSRLLARSFSLPATGQETEQRPSILTVDFIRVP